MNLQGLWPVLTLSFVVALSGAIMPGPLFTYTIAKTMQSRRRGFLVGLWVTLGHAALEALLIVGLLAGLSELLHNRVVIWVVGGLGCVLLLYMGIGLLRDVFRRRVPERDPEADEEPPPAALHGLGDGVGEQRPGHDRAAQGHDEREQQHQHGWADSTTPLSS